MQFLEITDKATHVVKTGAGYFQGIVVNNAGTTWTVQIFDDIKTSSPIATIAGATAFAVPAAGSTLAYDVHFSNGLTIVTAGTTAGSITVSYY